MSNLSVIAANNDRLVSKEKLQFATDIVKGLTQQQKTISSKYFYDNRGSELFNAITRHPDYYLTNCEIEILNNYKSTISNKLCSSKFNLIELGPGEGVKTSILLREFVKNNLDFDYIPIDVSASYLNGLVKNLKNTFPNLSVHPKTADYFNAIQNLSKFDKKNVVLFFGSSIGNYDLRRTAIFLKNLSTTLKTGDLVIIGFDLKKDLDILHRAYNDSSGLTQQFNLNLLNRINKELNANFKLNHFFHYPTYNVMSGAMESYIVSKMKQTIFLRNLNKSIEFEPFEPIHVEYSFKYHESQLLTLAETCNFSVIDMLYDHRQYFVDVLWQVN